MNFAEAASTPDRWWAPRSLEPQSSAARFLGTAQRFSTTAGSTSFGEDPNDAPACGGDCSKVEECRRRCPGEAPSSSLRASREKLGDRHKRSQTHGGRFKPEKCSSYERGGRCERRRNSKTPESEALAEHVKRVESEEATRSKGQSNLKRLEAKASRSRSESKQKRVEEEASRRRSESKQKRVEAEASRS